MAAACFGAVLFLTNQQLVSGRMISTQHWERFVDYPLVFLGAMLTSVWMLRRTMLRVDALYAFAGGGLVAAGPAWSPHRTAVFEEQFLVANLKSVAMKRAVESVEARGHRAEPDCCSRTPSSA